MPRGTRSGKTPQATPKNNKKVASATPSSADGKPAARTSQSPARTRGRASAAAEIEAVTPKRALRKRDVSKAELMQSSPETSKTAAVTSKRRRLSPQSEQRDLHPQPTLPPHADTTDLHKEEEEEEKEQGQKAPGSSYTHQTPARSTRSGSRKRRVAPEKSSPTTADSPGLSTRDPSSKKPRTSEGSTSSMMSPTVVVSPLTTPTAKTGAGNADCGATALPQNELFPTVRLTPMAELKEAAEGEEAAAAATEADGRPDCERSLTFIAPSTSKSMSVPDQTASPTEGMGDTVVVTDGDSEAATSAAVTGRASKLPPPLPSEPKPPTKEQLLTLQRRQLLQHLDHYDLSDLMSTSSLLANWPEVDAKPTAVSATSPPDAVKPSQRIWVLERTTTTNNANINTAQEGSRDAVSPPVNGTPEVQVTKQQLLSAASPAPDSIPTLDSFCIGSFTMSTPQAGELPIFPMLLPPLSLSIAHHHSKAGWIFDADLRTASVRPLVTGTRLRHRWAVGGDEPCSLSDEEDRLLLEVDTIKPDVFCLRNAPPNDATSRLRPELIRQSKTTHPSVLVYRDCENPRREHQRGYQSSACPEGPAFVNPSFIFYKRDIFTEVSFHHRPVQATARKLAYRCAYPQSWRDSLHQSISTTASLLDLEAGSKERAGEAADTGPELLVSVLRHTRTGSLLLVGCLTDQPGVDGKNSSFLGSPSKIYSSSCGGGIGGTTTSSSSSSSISVCNNNTTTSKSSVCNPISSSRGSVCNTVSMSSTRPLSSNSTVNSGVYGSLLVSHSAPASPHCVNSAWNHVPYVYCPTGAQTTTVSVARSGCLYSSLFSASGEWCPPTFKCRPDLAAVNAAGAFWVLQEIWEDEVVANSRAGLQNGLSNPVCPSLQNGFAAAEPTVTTPPSPPPFRWVLCGNLDAASTSPAYQICRDGYPSDDSITRLRSLIDLLWHAFQHPCTDVSSCYNSVLGREPPFTRFMLPPVASAGLNLRNCVDYIFCSSSTLHPRAVFVPPCRAVVSVASATGPSRPPSSRPLSQPETVISLAARLGIISVPVAS
ncbi:unnamed protein product [Schistocephalus solidus]|uniref:WD_REPEATS_REGION domain-containing protein n=1 Tax=Schistocephalus solidus TaxID=70667 RepID=A0A183T1W3_SCHSO|nr:unnamed protein product [Schistocephalus solidus]